MVFSLSLRTAKNLFTSIKNVSKTLQSIYYAPDQKKRHTLANCRVWFCLLHCPKSAINSFPSSKNASTFSSLFAIRKNPHFQAPACTCLFLRTAKNLFISKCLKNIALQTVSSQNRKNVVFRLVAQLFFLSTHCQKSFSVLSSKIFYTVLSAPTTGRFFTLSQSLGKNLQ